MYRDFRSGGIFTETKALVRSLIGMARNFDLQVVVEGIERPEQLQVVRELGANEVHGYLLGRPKPDAAFQIRSLLHQNPFAEPIGAHLDEHPSHDIPCVVKP